MGLKLGLKTELMGQKILKVVGRLISIGAKG